MPPLPDFIVAIGDALPRSVSERLRDQGRWPQSSQSEPRIVEHAPAPTVRVWTRGAIECRVEPTGGIGIAFEPEVTDAARRVLGRWVDDRSWYDGATRGRFAYVLWDAPTARVVACVDLFRTLALHYFQRAGVTVVANDLRLLLASGLVPGALCHRSLYHYLNVAYVPAPHSLIEDVFKIPAGQCLEGRAGSATLHRYRSIDYPEDLAGDVATRASALRAQIVDTVTAYRPPDGGVASGWGTFLSGGTDSSSIAGILTKGRVRELSSFSIGFAERGYDELNYVRIAAQRFGLDSHHRLVDEAAAVEAIPQIAVAFDEPFGNSSAIPTLYCARMAADAGVHTLIAGDGGDEIFGGNERYRKDAIYSRYHRAPHALKWTMRQVAASLPFVDSRLANRIRNFVYRGGLPNPDRFYTDDAFASEHFDSLLTPEFAAQVERDSTLALQREIYARANVAPTPASELNRLLYLDLSLTIADGDVVKVVKASNMAGVNVVFPYLDRTLVEFTGRLPAYDKVRGLRKRYLFKRAMAGILPAQILHKKKQGFGLPAGVWLRSPGRLRELVHDVLFSSRAAARGLFKTAFVRSLIERHHHGAWDYSNEIYLLLMLELWMREHLDSNA